MVLQMRSCELHPKAFYASELFSEYSGHPAYLKYNRNLPCISCTHSSCFLLIRSTNQQIWGVGRGQFFYLIAKLDPLALDQICGAQCPQFKPGTPVLWLRPHTNTAPAWSSAPAPWETGRTQPHSCTSYCCPHEFMKLEKQYINMLKLFQP